MSAEEISGFRSVSQTTVAVSAGLNGFHEHTFWHPVHLVSHHLICMMFKPNLMSCTEGESQGSTKYDGVQVEEAYTSMSSIYRFYMKMFH